MLPFPSRHKYATALQSSSSHLLLYVLHEIMQLHELCSSGYHLVTKVVRMDDHCKLHAALSVHLIHLHHFVYKTFMSLSRHSHKLIYIYFCNIINVVFLLLSYFVLQNLPQKVFAFLIIVGMDRMVCIHLIKTMVA